MTKAAVEVSFETYGGDAAANYQRYFVPAIGAPVAGDLLDRADLQRGERVLDLACGTGVIARLAAERAGSTGSVTGVDINPGMLAVARSITSSGAPIEWCEAPAEKLPLPDRHFHAVLCQYGLQFFSDRSAALREARRVLVTGGRVAVSVPGPVPNLFAAIEDKPERLLGPEAAGFLQTVFSLHEETELEKLLLDAGFEQVQTTHSVKRLQLPPPREFLWQYVLSTPLAAAAAALDEDRRASLEREVVKAWEPFTEDGRLILEVGMTVAEGMRPWNGT